MTARTVARLHSGVNIDHSQGVDPMALAVQPGGRRRNLGMASLTYAADVASDDVDVAHTRVFRGGAVGGLGVG